MAFSPLDVVPYGSTILKGVGAAVLLYFYLVAKYPDRAIGTKARPDIPGRKGLPMLARIHPFSIMLILIFSRPCTASEIHFTS